MIWGKIRRGNAALLLLADATQALGCDAEVGSDVSLGDALKDGTVFLDHIIVSLLRRVPHGGIEPRERIEVGSLKQDPKVPLQLGDLSVEDFQSLVGDPQQGGRFDGFNVIIRGFLGEKALQITDPAVFQVDLEDVFYPLFVHVVGSDCTGGDEIDVATDAPRHQKILLLFDGNRLECIQDQAFFSFIQFHPSLDVVDQLVVGYGHRSRNKTVAERFPKVDRLEIQLK